MLDKLEQLRESPSGAIGRCTKTDSRGRHVCAYFDELSECWLVTLESPIVDFARDFADRIDHKSPGSYKWYNDFTDVQFAELIETLGIIWIEEPEENGLLFSEYDGSTIYIPPPVEGFFVNSNFYGSYRRSGLAWRLAFANTLNHPVDPPESGEQTLQRLCFELSLQFPGRITLEPRVSQEDSNASQLLIQQANGVGVSTVVTFDHDGKFSIWFEGVLQRTRLRSGIEYDLMRLDRVLRIAAGSRMMQIRDERGNVWFQPRFAYLSGQGFPLHSSKQLRLSTTDAITQSGTPTWCLGKCTLTEAYGRYLIVMKDSGEEVWQVWVESPVDYFSAVGIKSEHENYFDEEEYQMLIQQLGVEWISVDQALDIRNVRFWFKEGPNPRRKQPFRRVRWTEWV